MTNSDTSLSNLSEVRMSERNFWSRDSLFCLLDEDSHRGLSVDVWKLGLGQMHLQDSLKGEMFFQQVHLQALNFCFVLTFSADYKPSVSSLGNTAARFEPNVSAVIIQQVLRAGGGSKTPMCIWDVIVSEWWDENIKHLVARILSEKLVDVFKNQP